MKLAKYYVEEGADELVFYDISASYENRKIFVKTVEKIAEEINIPFTVGGGITTVNDFYEALRAGADKISINSSAVKDPRLITEAAMKYGRQCVVLSIDAKMVGNDWCVFINGGRINTNKNAIAWAIEGEKLGAGEIVLKIGRASCRERV